MSFVDSIVSETTVIVPDDMTTVEIDGELHIVSFLVRQQICELAEAHEFEDYGDGNGVYCDNCGKAAR